MLQDKLCRKCDKVKRLDDFYVDSRRKSGRQSHCKECKKEYMRSYAPPHSSKHYTLKPYGITEEDYNEMLESQNGVCAICGGNNGQRSLAVDHCHETDKVRGLLCTGCNTAIGSLRDSPELCRNAALYLESYE